jgi:hypothetical protein
VITTTMTTVMASMTAARRASLSLTPNAIPARASSLAGWRRLGDPKRALAIGWSAASPCARFRVNSVSGRSPLRRAHGRFSGHMLRARPVRD